MKLKKKILLYLIPAIILIGVGVGFISVFFTSVGDEANQEYENLRASINEQLLVLEIISHTPILTIQNETTPNTEK